MLFVTKPLAAVASSVGQSPLSRDVPQCLQSRSLQGGGQVSL